MVKVVRIPTGLAGQPVVEPDPAPLRPVCVARSRKSINRGNLTRWAATWTSSLLGVESQPPLSGYWELEQGSSCGAIPTLHNSCSADAKASFLSEQLPT